jgi:hypothetical protein
MRLSLICSSSSSRKVSGLTPTAVVAMTIEASQPSKEASMHARPSRHHLETTSHGAFSALCEDLRQNSENELFQHDTLVH